MNLRVVLYTGLSLCFLPQYAFAETTKSGAQIDWLSTFGSLIFVVGFILLLAWALKRMKVPSLVNQKGLSIVRQIGVGNRERIIIVQAGEEQFLVGVTSQSIQLISKLESPLSLEEESVGPFSSQLTQLLKKNDKKV